MVQKKQCILIVPPYYHFTACQHHFALCIGLPTKSVHVSWYDIFLFEVFTFFKLATRSRFFFSTFCNKLQLVVTKWPPWACGCCTLTTNFDWLQGNCTSCLIGSNLSANVKVKCDFLSTQTATNVWLSTISTVNCWMITNSLHVIATMTLVCPSYGNIPGRFYWQRWYTRQSGVAAQSENTE